MFKINKTPYGQLLRGWIKTLVGVLRGEYEPDTRRIFFFFGKGLKGVGVTASDRQERVYPSWFLDGHR
jgi:hypothetical protein